METGIIMHKTFKVDMRALKSTVMALCNKYSDNRLCVRIWKVGSGWITHHVDWSQCLLALCFRDDKRGHS